MATREPLSVAIITRNEERNLERCLRSVAWADEIVVVDSGSTDRTLEIARRHGAEVFVEAWRGFVEQKNLAVERTGNLWVLSLDADEWIDPEGAAEIRATLENPLRDAYAFFRISSFSGAFLARTWSPDRQVRLFRKDRARFAGGRVHESLRVNAGATIGRLREPLFHLSYRSIGDYLERTDRYTDLAARSLRDSGRRFSIAKMLFSPPVTFLKMYVLRLGFLDGIRGFLVSAGSAYYVLLKHAKLWELARQPDPGFLRTAGVTAEDPDPAGTGESAPAAPENPREPASTRPPSR